MNFLALLLFTNAYAADSQSCVQKQIQNALKHSRKIETKIAAEYFNDIAADSFAQCLNLVPGETYKFNKTSSYDKTTDNYKKTTKDGEPAVEIRDSKSENYITIPESEVTHIEGTSQLKVNDKFIRGLTTNGKQPCFNMTREGKYQITDFHIAVEPDSRGGEMTTLLRTKDGLKAHSQSGVIQTNMVKIFDAASGLSTWMPAYRLTPTDPKFEKACPMDWEKSSAAASGIK
jgi:hypothetical protein